MITPFPKYLLFFALGAFLSFFYAFSIINSDNSDIEELRFLYSQPTSEWPEPHVDDSIAWQEWEPLPDSPYRAVDSLVALTELGKLLFFDPRLSSSDQISCSSCHDPIRNWSDGRGTALGHNHRQGNRNTPSISNIWAIEPLFWDGRAATLEDLIFKPIADHREMNQNPALLPEKIGNIEGYAVYFEAAFGDKQVSLDRMAAAMSQFQRTIKGRSSSFDRFLKGDQEALTDVELKGMHLFRTKARCMNCHHGPLFTDMKFHNVGLTYYGRKFQDLGRYSVTRDTSHVGAFKTPSLRNVAFTSPWMHNGLFTDLRGIVQMYSNGMPQPKPREGLENDPLFPTTSPILKKLELSPDEIDAVVAFLHAISSRSFRMRRPELPDMP